MRKLISLIVVCVLFGCQSAPVVQRNWEMPAGLKVAKVNGYDMAYAERGQGTPVVFVHGLGVDYRHFSAQMEPFAAARYRPIAVSLRRFYPEPWRGEGEFSLLQQSRDLAAFIRQLGSGPVHLVGHSYGGNVALYATQMAPHLVRTLTIAEGGGGIPAFTVDDSAQSQARAALFRSMTDKLARGETDAGLEMFVTFVNGPGAWTATPEAARQVLRDNAWTFAAYEADRDRWPRFSCEDARALNTPVLLMGAEKSPTRFGQILDKMQPCFRSVRRATVPNSSHAMARLNPAGFNSLLLGFLSSN